MSIADDALESLRRQQAQLKQSQPVPQQQTRALIEGWQDGMAQVRTSAGRQLRSVLGNRAIAVGDVLPTAADTGLRAGYAAPIPEGREVFIAAQQTSSKLPIIPAIVRQEYVLDDEVECEDLYRVDRFGGVNRAEAIARFVITDHAGYDLQSYFSTPINAEGIGFSVTAYTMSWSYRNRLIRLRCRPGDKISFSLSNPTAMILRSPTVALSTEENPQLRNGFVSEIYTLNSNPEPVDISDYTPEGVAGTIGQVTTRLVISSSIESVLVSCREYMGISRRILTIFTNVDGNQIPVGLTWGGITQEQLRVLDVAYNGGQQEVQVGSTEGETKPYVSSAEEADFYFIASKLLFYPVPNNSISTERSLEFNGPLHGSVDIADANSRIDQDGGKVEEQSFFFLTNGGISVYFVPQSFTLYDKFHKTFGSGGQPEWEYSIPDEQDRLVDWRWPGISTPPTWNASQACEESRFASNSLNLSKGSGFSVDPTELAAAWFRDPDAPPVEIMIQRETLQSASGTCNSFPGNAIKKQVLPLQGDLPVEIEDAVLEVAAAAPNLVRRINASR